MIMFFQNLVDVYAWIEYICGCHCQYSIAQHVCRLLWVATRHQAATGQRVSQKHPMDGSNNNVEVVLCGSFDNRKLVTKPVSGSKTCACSLSTALLRKHLPDV